MPRQRQTAFLFIKPHAVNDKVIAYLTNQLHQNNYNIIKSGNLSASTMAKGSLVSKHYGTLAQRAMSIVPADLPLPASTSLAKFQTEFGMSYQDAVQQQRVLNVSQYIAKHKINMEPFEFEKEWRSNSCVKLFPGTYCAAMSNGSIVVNGFFPAMRAKFTSEKMAPRGIHWFVVDWDESETSWHTFRTEFIGATDPTKAGPHSVRGHMRKNWKEFDLSHAPSGSDNGVHASASPVEAAYEIGHVWLANIIGTLEDTDVWVHAKRRGLSDSSIRSWLTNVQPHETSFDSCEHQNLTTCLNLMCAGEANQQQWQFTVPMFFVSCTFLFLFNVVYNNGDQRCKQAGMDLFGPLPLFEGDALQTVSFWILIGTLVAHFVEFMLISVMYKRFPSTIVTFLWTMLYGFLYWNQFDTKGAKRKTE